MGSLPTDDAGWFELVMGNQPHVWRLIANACDGEVFTDEGLQAAIVPASPNRSFFNSVFDDDSEHLTESLPRLAEVYDEAGINAWTVWIRPATTWPARLSSGRATSSTPAPA